MELFIIFLILIIGVLILYIIKNKNLLNSKINSLKEQYNLDLQKLKDDKYQQLSKELQDKWNRDHQSLLSEIDTYRGRLNEFQSRLSQINREILEKQQFNNSLLKMREEELDRLMESKQAAADQTFQHKIEQTKKDIDEWAQSAQEAATEIQRGKRAELQLELDSTQLEIKKVKNWLAEYQQKQESINKEIMRQREINEKEDFYRIQLTDAAKQDINYLITILDHFINKEIIYKLIWSEYIQKPFKSMLNRVLQNRDPRNVIYMIKNTKTQEIYIGKTSANISTRWTSHIKSSLSIGTLSGAVIHKALFNNWDNFIFSILEEVPIEDNLSDREKYYINFYQSDIYGYNLKVG